MSTNEKPLRAGVIGLGIGKTHVERYARLAGAELGAVCDLDRALADQLATQYGCDTFSDPLTMLDAARLDVVSICTPPKLHPELTAAAADRGIAVLVEKPMASTVGGCQEMIEVCRARGVTLMVGHKKRYAPPFVELRALTTPTGPLGPIRQVTLKYMHGGMSPKAWFWSESDGGGPILENHVHAADTLGFLVGAPRRVYAEGATRFVAERAPQLNVAGYTARFTGRDEADGDVIVASGYGMIGPLPMQPLCDEAWFFGCERGAAEVTGPFDNLQRLRWVERGSRTNEIHDQAWPEADPFLFEIEHFLACVRTGAPPRSSGEAGLQAVRFCLAVKESAWSGKVVEL